MIWWNQMDLTQLSGACLLCLTRGMTWMKRVLGLAVGAPFPKAFEYLWLAYVLLTSVAAKHLKKVLAHFVAVRKGQV
jgi:hypothetical protein